MDILCVVCAEPWDCHLDGSMNKWEIQLFRAGAGCPCCEGRKPDPEFVPQSIFDLENGDRDPIERLHAWEDSQAGTAPQWERPTPVIKWTCNGCQVNVVVNPDDDSLEYDLPRGARGHQWYASHRYTSRNAEPTEEPAHIFGDGPDALKVCEFCLDRCERCSEPVSSVLTSEELGDPYQPGYCDTLHNYGFRDLYCVECIELACCECGGLPGDCDCCTDCNKRADDCICPTCPECEEKLSGCECEENYEK